MEIGFKFAKIEYFKIIINYIDPWSSNFKGRYCSNFMENRNDLVIGLKLNKSVLIQPVFWCCADPIPVPTVGVRADQLDGFFVGMGVVRVDSPFC